MGRITIWKRAILMELLFILLLVAINGMTPVLQKTSSQTKEEKKEKKDSIKWVEFNPTCEAMTYAYETDMQMHGTEQEIGWVSLLAYAAAKSGGTFDKNSVPVMRKLVKQIIEKETTLGKATEKLEYYPYYLEAYEAVLGGMVGEYEIEGKDDKGNTSFQKKYGLKAFLPIAKGFPYNDYDDFGSSRSFGYKRQHLGHDMMGQIGTPIIAVESGTVEAIGWNRYGGWRIGIRSFRYGRAENVAGDFGRGSEKSRLRNGGSRLELRSDGEIEGELHQLVGKVHLNLTVLGKVGVLVMVWNIVLLPPGDEVSLCNACALVCGDCELELSEIAILIRQELRSVVRGISPESRTFSRIFP